MKKLLLITVCLIAIMTVLMSSIVSTRRSAAVSTITNKTQIAYNEKIKATLICDSLELIVVLKDDILLSRTYATLSEQIEQLILDDSTSKTKCNIGYVKPPYSISKRGMDFIKSAENCKLCAYKLKGERYYTIGYGHQIRPGDNIPHKITQAQADNIFKKDMPKYDSCVNRLMAELSPKFKVTQGFIDGMCSLVYNCGEEGVRRTTFFKRLKACRFNKTTNEINKQDFAYALEAIKTANVSWPGHKPRRQKEFAMMSKNK